MSVILWAIFYWETLGPAIYMDVNLTRATYKLCNRTGTPIHDIGVSGLVEVASFSRIEHPVTLHTLFRNQTLLRNMIKSSRGCPDLKIVQISIQCAIGCKSLGARYHRTPSGVL